MGNLRGSTKGKATVKADLINYIKGSASGASKVYVSFEGAFSAHAYRLGNFYSSYDFGSAGAFEATAFNPVDFGGNISLTMQGGRGAVASGHCTVSAKISGYYLIHPSASGHCTVAVTLMGNGRVYGSTTGLATIKASIQGLYRISGHAAGFSTVHMKLEIPPLFIADAVQVFGSVKASAVTNGNQVVCSANILGRIQPVTVRPK